jgi:TPR repeat protein
VQHPLKSAFGAGLLVLILLGGAIAGTLGDGVVAYQRGDYAAAVGLLRPLADQGNTTAQANLGVLYANGQGVPQDYAQAVMWYHKAADHGDADAQANLGFMYFKGLGVPQDRAQAILWYRRAADQGNARAQHDLSALVQDRASVLPSLQRLCQNDLLASHEDLTMLAVLRISLEDFCNCIATQMLSHLSAPQVAAYSLSSQLPSDFDALWQKTGQFCKALLFRP